jgi:hypothetical protein
VAVAIVRKCFSLLRSKFQSPVRYHWGAYVSALGASLAVLLLAGVGGTVAVACAVGTGLVAELGVEVFGRRRGRAHELRNRTAR